jgi:hypothetical protein
MLPQSPFMVVAPIIDGRVDELKALLASMNDQPGMARPDNPLVPFGQFENLHFARFIILDDKTVGDFAALGAPIPDFDLLLTFLGDCDGSADALLADMARRAAPGLRQIFACCEGYTANADLLAWMKAHSQAPAANYVNWIGRTVKQVREEAVFRERLVEHVTARQDEFRGDEPQQVRAKLVSHGRSLLESGVVKLTPAPRTPLGWSIRNFLHYAIVPALLLLPWLLLSPLLPFHPFFVFVGIPSLALGAMLFVFLNKYFGLAMTVLLVLGFALVPLFILFPLLIPPVALIVVVFLVVLRHYEKNEPEVIHRPEVSHIIELSTLEDHDVSNQFTALGAVKPSLFRRWLFIVLLWAIDYAARHLFGEGHLGRIRTIHFARWVFLENKRRVVFCSNYDGSHEAYMDDFINKAGWGLNIAFACGVGYPRTRWIIKDGADYEMKFKYTQRRHQVPTQTWYRAYPGLTVYDLERNARVRAGFERHSMSDAEVRDWLWDL